MDNTETMEESKEVEIKFPESVLSVIEQVLPNADQLDNPDFNTINYINSLFPTEQSLSNIDSVVSKMEYKISTIDDEIQTLVRGQNVSRTDGQMALEAAQKVIKELAVQVKDINKKAERSEEMVKEITCEIKQLDCAKCNLTAAITTLNHLHMLVGGIESLKSLTQKRLYKEILLPLQAIMEVIQHFESYTDIKQIKDLRDQVLSIKSELGTQIMADFSSFFLSPSSKHSVTNKTLAEACLVVSTLEPKVKKELLDWFIGMQLQEYMHLFSRNQDTAWLDQVDKRYAWIKRHLIRFEESLGNIFPQPWEVSEMMVVEFCKMTKSELTKVMAARKQEIDVKLLLYAIQKTYHFESLLDKRFTGITLREGAESAKKSSKDAAKSPSQPASTNPFENGEDEPAESPGLDASPGEADAAGNDAAAAKSPFIGLVGCCFEPYLYLYIESLDTNLAELMERFVQDAKQSPLGDVSQSSVLPSCADLFLFYKKCMVQCAQLTTGQPMLGLTAIFQKYLRGYAVSVLQGGLPKVSGGAGGPGDQLTSLRDLQSVATSSFMHNFSNLLKEGDCTTRFTKQELSRITCIITTSEYCLETTVHLEQKLKEKVTPNLSDKIDLSQEQDLFHKIISNSIQLLVQDLEIACEPSLLAMTKISWQNIDSVGDQSSYVTQIISHLKTTVPILRDNLSSSRKYFTQFCIKFANSFIPKFIQNIYKCKPISTVGTEQLLLDTHMLKTVLIDLPSIASQVKRQAPATYTKVVIKSMTKAEMVLKLVMAPLSSSGNISAIDNFIDQYVRLLPECTLNEFHKVLEMKGVKLNRAQVSSWDTIFRQKCKQSTAAK